MAIEKRKGIGRYRKVRCDQDVRHEKYRHRTKEKGREKNEVWRVELDRFRFSLWFFFQIRLLSV
jgi:hypothetical protein